MIDARTYPQVNKISFDAIRSAFARSDIHLPNSTTGKVEAGHGFSVSWYHNPDTQELKLSLDGPGFLMGMAWSKIEQFILPYIPNFPRAA